MSDSDTDTIGTILQGEYNIVNSVKLILNQKLNELTLEGIELILF